ncbi:tryptophan synthase beta subunit-like PLP-dependent enzyme [Daldinia caldariorum]|uniref:tryptophan synthase beta subunit-like PLP-dependent enzyme n=1 Tax=Daldinia caldariorum TaxID=326644 RepID=UPI002007274D|nr:tryptophan synthase beta subunit-like PLP-dependent enzyme [Daldinia caldariorum]KAI1468048.1 tryptophan synthase beta subunit-like PLP-dependent enzyme [Daldinia caldariorum]
MADPSTSPPLTRESVAAARELIKPFVHRTPVITSSSLSALASDVGAGAGPGPESEGEAGAGAGGGKAKPKAKPKLRLWFKCENFQKVGAFKARGAFHAVERLKREPGWLEGGGAKKGVVTHSSGNHAQALSLAARANGIHAYIVMPSISAPPKIAATKGYGAKVVFSGSTSVEREAVTTKVIEDTGARLVPPYDHPDIILGQGTLGLEFQEQVEAMIAEEHEKEKTTGEKGGETTRKKRKGLDAIIAPCGGGGMLSGVALSCEGTGIRVFGSEPSFQGADDAKRGYESGVRVEAVSSLTVADGLRTPLGRVPWSVIYERRLVAGFYSVSEAEIIRALRLAYERLKVVVEPSSAVPLAVALYNEDFRAMVEREAGEDGWDVGIVFSGGNVSLEALGKLFSENSEVAK